ncbi:MAG: site-2 protease family protein [Pseudomonadota bacterium]
MDASWLLIAALITWSLSAGYFPDTLPDATQAMHLAAAFLAMIGLFLSLILHELAHALMARHYGLSIAGITLFLFGGVAEMETEPGDPTVEIWVAAVGPLASLVLAALFWSSTTLGEVLGAGTVAVSILAYLAAINLVLALFNMVPAFPLDGGRVFRAVVWRHTGDLLAATRRAADVSAIFSWCLIALGVIAIFNAGLGAGLWPILVGLFLLAVGRASLQQTEMRELFSGRTVADLMTRNPVVVRPNQSLAEVVNRVFLTEGVSFAPVVEDLELLGYLDLHIIRRIDREHWANTMVEDVIEGLAPDNALSPDTPAQTLLDRMSTSDRRKFLVVEQGSLRGVVTISDVTAHLNVARQLAVRA